MQTKRCPRCKQEKDVSEFYTNKSKKDGYHDWCKNCHNDFHKQKYIEDPETRKQNSREWRLNNPLKNLIRGCNSRANKNHIYHDSPKLLYEYLKPIYENGKCEFCGAELKSYVGEGNGKHKNSFSIDQIIPSEGYKVGNVAILCLDCNMKKRNNTYEDFKKWVIWFEERIKILRGDKEN